MWNRTSSWGLRRRGGLGPQGEGWCEGGGLWRRGGTRSHGEGQSKSGPWGKGRCGGGRPQFRHHCPPPPHTHFFGASAAPLRVLSLSHPGTGFSQRLSTRHSGAESGRCECSAPLEILAEVSPRLGAAAGQLCTLVEGHGNHQTGSLLRPSSPAACLQQGPAPGASEAAVRISHEGETG